MTPVADTWLKTKSFIYKIPIVTDKKLDVLVLLTSVPSETSILS